MLVNIASITLLATAVAAAENALNYDAILKRDLVARQTASSLPTQCISAISNFQSIITSFPTPPPKLVSDLASQTITDPCKFTPPASLSKEYADYSSTALSWYSAHSADFSSLEKECPAITSDASRVAVCSTGAAAKATGGSSSDTTGSSGSAAAPKATGSGSDTAAAPKATGSSTGTSAAPKSTDKGNSASTREASMVLAVVVAAGFAVAAL